MIEKAWLVAVSFLISHRGPDRTIEVQSCSAAAPGAFWAHSEALHSQLASDNMCCFAKDRIPLHPLLLSPAFSSTTSPPQPRHHPCPPSHGPDTATSPHQHFALLQPPFLLQGEVSALSELGRCSYCSQKRKLWAVFHSRRNNCSKISPPKTSSLGPSIAWSCGHEFCFYFSVCELSQVWNCLNRSENRRIHGGQRCSLFTV